MGDTARPPRRLGGMTVAIAVAVAVIGSAAFGTLSASGGRAAASYLAGLVIAGAVFAGSVAAVRWSGSVQPVLGMIVAMLTYTLVVIGFAVVLAVASPDVIDRWGFATGLVVAAVGWMIGQVRSARPGGQR